MIIPAIKYCYVQSNIATCTFPCLTVRYSPLFSTHPFPIFAPSPLYPSSLPYNSLPLPISFSLLSHLPITLKTTCTSTHPFSIFSPPPLYPSLHSPTSPFSIQFTPSPSHLLLPAFSPFIILSIPKITHVTVPRIAHFRICGLAKLRRS